MHQICDNKPRRQLGGWNAGMSRSELAHNNVCYLSLTRLNKGQDRTVPYCRSFSRIPTFHCLQIVAVVLPGLAGRTLVACCVGCTKSGLHGFHLCDLLAFSRRTQDAFTSCLPRSFGTIEFRSAVSMRYNRRTPPMRKPIQSVEPLSCSPYSRPPRGRGTIDDF